MFEEIKEKCSKKKVVSLCNKLAKKCSFKSGKDAENICHLMYWLYVYGFEDEALKLSATTHDVPFDGNYTVWTFLHDMWGLEARILRGKVHTEQAQILIDIIDERSRLPILGRTPEKQWLFEQKRRTRFVYSRDPVDIDGCIEVSRKLGINEYLKDNKLNWANDLRLIALLGMIGLSETGFYPNLNEHKNDIEEDINEYILELRKVK